MKTHDSPPLGLARRVQEEEAQQTLWDIDPDWNDLWWGMPSFTQKNALPSHRIVVNFMCFEDAIEFARRLGIKVTPRTDSAWFPPDVIDAPCEWEYASES